MDLRRDVRSFIESKLIMKRERPTFGDDENFFELRLVSSLFAMELVTHLERTYSVTFEDDDLDLANFRSIDAIVRFVERKRPAPTALSEAR